MEADDSAAANACGYALSQQGLKVMLDKGWLPNKTLSKAGRLKVRSARSAQLPAFQGVKVAG